MSLQRPPFLLYSDGQGNVFEDTSLYAAGRSGHYVDPVPTEDSIDLADGGNLYELPNRRGLGIDVNTGEIRLCDKGWAVAAFVPPAYTGLYTAPFANEEGAQPLPLFCYTTVGYHKGKNYVPAVRIEQDIRQECAGFDQNQVELGIDDLRQQFPHNRIVEHLSRQLRAYLSLPGRPQLFHGALGVPGAYLAGLQFQLHRVYFHATAGRAGAFAAVSPRFQTQRRRDRGVCGAASGKRALSDHQFRAGLRG